MNFFNRIKFGAMGLLGVVVMAAALLVTAPSSGQAQSFRHQAFLQDGLYSLTVSNGLQYTNLQSSGVYKSNVTGLVYTQITGVTNGVQATTNIAVGTNVAASLTKQLTKDVALWGDREAYGWVSTNQIPANISVTLVGGTGANSAVTLTFVPLPDGVHESTIAGDSFAFAVTANGATPVTQFVTAPLYKWQGCGKLRLKTAVNADTDAASNVQLLDVSLNGYAP